jgi:hypothetical protein
MIRTKHIQPAYTYRIEEEPIVLSKAVMDLLLQQDKPADLIALYCFYYYTAKWQGLNQCKATISYVAKGLQWTKEKVYKNKNILTYLGLIESVRKRNNSGKIDGHYVRVNFMWSNVGPVNYESHSLVHQDGNTDTTNNKILFVDSVKSIEAKQEKILQTSTPTGSNIPIVPSLFETFWKLYPRKTDKGKAKTAWDKLCSKPVKERPTWKVIRTAIKEQSESERWSDPKYIPMPTTWIHQNRWLDDPQEMKTFKKDSEGKAKYKISFGRKYFLDPTDGCYYALNGEMLS